MFQANKRVAAMFIICQDVLSRMIDKEQMEGRISGVNLKIDEPAFTHVIYADDLMLFSKANRREITALNECLKRYCS